MTARPDGFGREPEGGGGPDGSHLAGPGGGDARDGLDWTRATDDLDPDAPCIEMAAGEGDLVHIRQSDSPDRIVTTTRDRKSVV